MDAEIYGGEASQQECGCMSTIGGEAMAEPQFSWEVMPDGNFDVTALGSMIPWSPAKVRQFIAYTEELLALPIANEMTALGFSIGILVTMTKWQAADIVQRMGDALTAWEAQQEAMAVKKAQDGFDLV